MSSLLDFISAVFGQWELFASLGGLLTIGYDRWAVPHMKWQPPARLFYTIGLLWFSGCLFFAFYAAWNEERKDAIQARAAFDALSSPKLEIEIDYLGLGNMSGDAIAVVVTAIAAVKNNGAPSICENWTLTVTADNSPTIAKPVFLEEFSYLQFDNGITPVLSNRKIAFKKGENLSNKSLTPIPKGGLVRGYLLFVYSLSQFKSAEQIQTSATNYTLSCSDVTGVRVETARNWNMESDGGAIRVFPGMEYATYAPTPSK